MIGFTPFLTKHLGTASRERDMNGRSLFFVAVGLLNFFGAALVQTIPLTCNSDIGDGISVDFQQSGANVNDVLVGYEVAAP